VTHLSLPYPRNDRFSPEWIIQFWVDACEIFGSGDAPNEWEIFLLPFMHLIRLESPLLRLLYSFVDNCFVLLPPFLLRSDKARVTNKASKALYGFFDRASQKHHDDDFGTSQTALGLSISTLPGVSVSIKPAKLPLVRALLRVLSSSPAVSRSLLEAAVGLFLWLGTLIPRLACFVPPLRAVLVAATARRAKTVNIELPRFSDSARSLGYLFGAFNAPNAKVPDIAFRGLTFEPTSLLIVTEPVVACLKMDASPDKGLGGVSLSARSLFHSPWNHQPASPEADGISSTLAEALALLVAVLLYALPGILIAQTDSCDLFLAWSRGRSKTQSVNTVVQAIVDVTLSRGCHLVLHHILRDHNSVSDAMASNTPLVRAHARCVRLASPRAHSCTTVT
jgi:hypothetical protein